MKQPLVSVIIPTYNRPSQLTQCLKGLSQLIYPQNHFEIIVVDDGSPVDMTSVIDKFRNQLSLTLLHQPRGAPARLGRSPHEAGLADR